MHERHVEILLSYELLYLLFMCVAAYNILIFFICVCCPLFFFFFCMSCIIMIIDHIFVLLLSAERNSLGQMKSMVVGYSEA